jgi:hypothetical protein
VGKRNPLTSLGGMQISRDTVEKNMEIPHKTKNETALLSNKSTPRDIPGEI